MPRPTATPGQQALPIQPVARPILCSPYAEPTAHWMYDTETGEARQIPGRRPASYWFKTQRVADQQLSMFAEEEREDLPLVNALRADVKRWRESGYEGATEVTKILLRHWSRADSLRRLFFCQLEAVETIIFLNEIRLTGRSPRFTPKFTDEHIQHLLDRPAAPDLAPLTRLGCKMATGSGKTVVMAMLIAWAFCNRGKVPGHERFPTAVLVVCPNLTIKERLQVLRPDRLDNYYAAFDLVPSGLRPLLHTGKVLITNWHLFAPESEHAEGGKSYAVVNKGAEGPAAFAQRVLGDLAERGPILVLNDEAHHAWRPKPLPEAEKISKETEAEIEEATIWIEGLDKLNQAVGIRCCVDLSATPFYLQGSGHVEGAPFPWLVSDFGLVDAIESGIVKIPRLPVSTNTGRPEPEFFRLYRYIIDQLQPGDFFPGKGKKPKPEAVWREAMSALTILASQWVERFEYVQSASNEQDKTPPVMIIVCDNTDIAEVFYRLISGEESHEIIDASDDDSDEDETPLPTKSKKKPKTKVVYGQGQVFPAYFSNRPGFTPTIRIDSKLLAEAESGSATGNKKEAAEELRRVVATVGKAGEPGEQVRCIVSVAMLNEGWDANNVTHILGLRAFDSQLLCEQVVGRGLRRMDYDPDPKTGLLTEEYVDIYGVPFTLIPFKGRPKETKTPEDKPKNHVYAMLERAAYEMKFPVVESYAFALRRNVITADISAMQITHIDPATTPTDVFVMPRVGHQVGDLKATGPGKAELHDRQAYYASTHLQTIEFEMARQIVFALVGDQYTDPKPDSNPRLRLQSRHQLFPQVLRYVRAYVERKVDFHGVHPCELGLEKYFRQVVERLLSAIRPDDTQGEPPLMPILNRYKPIGSTAEVDFKTTRPCFSTFNSHLNLVAADTQRWEQSAAFRLEEAVHRGLVKFYARNDQLGFSLPYVFMNISHHYEPDYLVRLANDVTLVLEIKGAESEQDRAKHQAAQRWQTAVNNLGKQRADIGQWAFHVNRDPQVLVPELGWILGQGTAR